MMTDVAHRQLKANDPVGTREKFEEALAAGVKLPGNLLSGVLNQFAKAGWMDQCMRVCQEMKGKNVCHFPDLQSA